MKEKKSKRTQAMISKSEREFPGVAVNIDDGKKVSEARVDQRTCMLNNNPRNSK